MQDKGQAQVCPFCGYREGTPAAAPHYLKPGTVLAGKYLVGDAQIGEYFRVFVCYAIISLALVLHAWRRHADKERARASLRGESGGAA